MTACSAERTLTFVLLILAEFSSSWLHFSEQDGVDNTRHGISRSYPLDEMSQICSGSAFQSANAFRSRVLHYLLCM